MPPLRGPCRFRRAPARPALEPLEDRTQPSALSFAFQVDDPAGEFNAFPLLRTDLNAAGQILSHFLGGTGTIQVLVRPDDSIPRADGTCIGVTGVGQVGALAVEESAPVTAARTGVDPNGPGAPEMVIYLNAQTYLKQQVWFDPSGAARTAAIPADKVDFISVVLHETLHGCGFTGYRTVGGPNDGQLSGSYESPFDVLTRRGAGGNPGGFYFVGPNAMAAYGGPVPLTSQGTSTLLTSHNYYEVGNPAGQPGADLAGDLMSGVLFANGKRYTPSKVDLAILADLGWNVSGFPTPAGLATVPPPTSQPTPAPPPANLAPNRRPAQRHSHHAHHHHRHATRQLRHAASRRPGRRPAENPLASLLWFV
jgi:hypothetical protein